MAGTNQRRHRRRRTRLRAAALLSWGHLEGHVENIAEGGAFFVTDTLEGPAAVGDTLSLDLPGLRGGTSVPGTILRVDRYLFDGDLLRSFAIRFDRPLALDVDSAPDP